MNATIKFVIFGLLLIMVKCYTNKYNHLEMVVAYW
jgi:hypothetical protein